MLYSDATKKFSSDFVHITEVFVSEKISSLTITAGNSAFSFLDNSFLLSKFNLLSEQVTH